MAVLQFTITYSDVASYEEDKSRLAAASHPQTVLNNYSNNTLDYKKLIC